MKNDLPLVNMQQNVALQLLFVISGSFPNLKENSVQGWRDAYCQEVLNQSTDRKRNRPVEVTELPQKCRVRPLLLGEELKKEVKLL